MDAGLNYLPDCHNPFRPPDRRWLRAGYLVDHGERPLTGCDDAATTEAWRYRLALNRTDADRERLAEQFPAIAEAHVFFTGAAPLRKAELEARLLGNQDDDAIARKLGLSPAAVAAYHDLFYDVRPVLDAGGYIANMVIGQEKLRPHVQPGAHETLMKLLGYGMGGRGVDDYLDYLAHPPVLPRSLNQLDVPALQTLRNRLTLHLLVLTQTTPVTATDPATWLRLSERFNAIQQASQSRAENATTIRSNVHVLLDLVTSLSRDVMADGGAGGIYPMHGHHSPDRQTTAVLCEANAVSA
jgi:hypothetical protein